MERQDSFELSDELVALVTKIAGDEGLNDDLVEVVQDGKTSFFEGYTSNVFFVTVKEPPANKVLRLAVKLAISEISNSFGYAIKENYYNECLFYKELWPTFRNLQEQSVGRLLVDVVPKCYFSNATAGEEKIVMDNLKASGYVTFPRSQLYNREHLDLFFTSFGEYHALSFAYKSLSPKGFADFAGRFREVRNYSNHKLFQDQLMLAYKQCAKFCKEDLDTKICDRLGKYVADCNTFFEVLNYRGEHAVFAHGDCWSNNLLFKYDGEQPVSLKLIDFQDTNARSSIHDLSYNFYSGADANEFPNLLNYLRKYHESLCRILRHFNMDGHVLYPFPVLESEWKTYSKFGFTMSLLTTKLKHAYEGQELTLPDIMQSDKDPEELEADKYDVEAVRRRFKEIVTHFYENDFL